MTQEDKAPPGSDSNRPPESGCDPVWTFRGLQLKAGEFTTAMVHFFRAEVQRANVWRQRLDTTTNWAVVTTGAAISFAFTHAAFGHVVILLNIILVTMFLMIEARRYRYYELWSTRVRLMETDFFAAMLVPPFHPSPDWAEGLAENLLTPKFPIKKREAIGRRLRRNYIWIYLVVGLSWLANLSLLPEPARSLGEIFARGRLGNISGEALAVLVALFFLGILAFALGTLGYHQAAGEVLPRYDSLPAGLIPTDDMAGRKRRRPWFRQARRRQQLLTFIVTGKPQQVAARIMKEMNRGATVIAGKGAFTGEARAVLMCALTVTEVAALKALVEAEDPTAFVIVSPAQGVFGKGFMPFEADS